MMSQLSHRLLEKGKSMSEKREVPKSEGEENEVHRTVMDDIKGLLYLMVLTIGFMKFLVLFPNPDDPGQSTAGAIMIVGVFIAHNSGLIAEKLKK